MTEDRTGVVVGAVAITAAVFIGYLAGTGHTESLTTLLMAAAALFVALAAPFRVVVLVAGVAALISPDTWPTVASLSGLDIYIGDLLLALAGVAALLRPKHGGWRAAAVLLTLLGLLVATGSSSSGAIAFFRLVAPVAAMLLVAWAAPNRHDFWRDARWVVLAVLAGIPLAGGLDSSRWHSWAGGPNETALLAAVAVVLGFTHRQRLWRYGLMAAGVTALAGTAAITGTAAAVVGVLVYSFGGRKRSRRLGKGSPVIAAWVLLLAVFAVPAMRPDIAQTIAAHLYQAHSFFQVMLGGDPLLGTGWVGVGAAVFSGSDVWGLHNVYLDVLAYTGIIGGLLVAALLVMAWRCADLPTRAVLAVWLVWVNTTGAFPGVAWGVLGFVLAAASLQQRLRQEPLPDDGLTERPTRLRVGSI